MLCYLVKTNSKKDLIRGSYMSIDQQEPEDVENNDPGHQIPSVAAHTTSSDELTEGHGTAGPHDDSSSDEKAHSAHDTSAASSASNAHPLTPATDAEPTPAENDATEPIDESPPAKSDAIEPVADIVEPTLAPDHVVEQAKSTSESEPETPEVSSNPDEVATDEPTQKLASTAAETSEVPDVSGDSQNPDGSQETQDNEFIGTMPSAPEHHVTPQPRPQPGHVITPQQFYLQGLFPRKIKLLWR